jgi:REP element-mobilizing transposase RayT
MRDRYNPVIHHRRSIRLQRYDYSKAGLYFITICSAGRAYLFGEIMDGVMHLNDEGKIVEAEWLRTPEIRADVTLDAFVVMPNHMHGIVVITSDRVGDVGNAGDVGDVGDVGRMQYAPTSSGDAFRSPSQTIGAIVRGFKSAATKRINDLRGTSGISVWQRNYYEHIVRDDADLDRIRAYIANNPRRWSLDRLHPDNTSK